MRRRTEGDGDMEAGKTVEYARPSAACARPRRNNQRDDGAGSASTAGACRPHAKEQFWRAPAMLARPAQRGNCVGEHRRRTGSSFPQGGVRAPCRAPRKHGFRTPKGQHRRRSSEHRRSWLPHATSIVWSAPARLALAGHRRTQAGAQPPGCVVLAPCRAPRKHGFRTPKSQHRGSRARTRQRAVLECASHAGAPRASGAAALGSTGTEQDRASHTGVWAPCRAPRERGSRTPKSRPHQRCCMVDLYKTTRPNTC